jgi:protein disulfide-isomerase/protein disulfide isomerase family A protein 5
MKSLTGLLVSGLLLVAADEGNWEGGSMVLLDDAGFASFQEKNTNFLAAFFAPWCGHCKALKPEYSAAAETLQFRVPLVGVDCTEAGKETCAKFDVTGFPTLIWFSNGKTEPYEGARTADALVAFVETKVPDVPENFEGADFNTFKLKQLKKILFDRGQDCAGCTEKKEFVKKVQESIHLPKASKSKPKKYEGPSTLVNGRTFAQERRYKAAKEVANQGWEDNGKIVHLVDDEFEEFRKANGTVFVMFYAPWCGHCKEFKPAYAEASKSSPIPLIALECETNTDTCRKYGATSYPTLKLFKAGEKAVDYSGKRTAPALLKWISKQQSGNPDEPDAWTNEPLWEDNNGAVVHMTADYWDSFRSANPKAFVLFYAPWCGHCKAIKPDWADLSIDVKGVMPVVAVDCTEHASLCSKYKVEGYPTIRYFPSSSSEGEVYNGGRTFDDLTAFVKSKAGKQDL